MAWAFGAWKLLPHNAKWFGRGAKTDNTEFAFVVLGGSTAIG